MVSHPETEVLRIYGGSRVADLWDEKGLNIEPDMVLRYRDPWSMFLDFAAARALDAIIPRTDSRAFDPIVTPGSTI